MSARRRAVDPVQRELFRHAVAALVDEMAVAMVRTARSTHLKNSMDLSSALCDPEGRLIAQGLTLPLHLGSVPDAMRAFLARFGGEMRPGDVYALNDPYAGGTHLPDIYTAQPVFRGGRVIGHVVTIAHHADVGGKTAGGNGCDATELFQEGICLPPVRLMAEGEPVEHVWRLLERNVRVPNAGAGRPAGAAGGGTRGRARAAGAGGGAWAAAAGRPGRGGAGLRGRAGAAGDSGDSGRGLRIHRLPGRRWDRPGADSDTGDAACGGGPDHGRLHGVGRAGAGVDQLPDAVHQVGGVRLCAVRDADGYSEQRGAFQADRGDGAGGDDRESASAGAGGGAGADGVPDCQRGAGGAGAGGAGAGAGGGGGGRHGGEPGRVRRAGRAVRDAGVPVRVVGRAAVRGRAGRGVERGGELSRTTRRR